MEWKKEKRDIVKKRIESIKNMLFYPPKRLNKTIYGIE